MSADENETIVGVTRRQALTIGQNQARNTGVTIVGGFSTASCAAGVTRVAYSVDEHKAVVGVARRHACASVVKDVRGVACQTIGVIRARTGGAAGVAGLTVAIGVNVITITGVTRRNNRLTAAVIGELFTSDARGTVVVGDAIACET